MYFVQMQTSMYRTPKFTYVFFTSSVFSFYVLGDHGLYNFICSFCWILGVSINQKSLYCRKIRTNTAITKSTIIIFRLKFQQTYKHTYIYTHTYSNTHTHIHTHQPPNYTYIPKIGKSFIPIDVFFTDNSLRSTYTVGFVHSS